MSKQESVEDAANHPLEIEKLHAVKLFPLLSERAEWEALLQDPVKKACSEKIIAEAETLLNTEILELPASKYMEYGRTGNRGHFEKVYFERRKRLECLLLAEAFEYKGRFTDRLIDEIVAILNEPTWTIPAHIGAGVYLKPEHKPDAPDPLKYFGYEVVDLFSAETSAYMSTVYLLANKELRAVSQGLVRRMCETLLDRAIRTFDLTGHYWWMKSVMNWNPWICSNLMCTANNLFQDDPEALTKYVKDVLQPCMNIYMQGFPADGGCDEGPSYWGVSALRGITYMEYLYRQSDGKLSLYDSPKFRKMGEYIADMMLGDNYYVNFADCPARPGNINPGFLCEFATHTGSDKLKTFCIQYRAAHPMTSLPHSGMQLTLANLFWEKPHGDTAMRGDFCAWYELLQVLSIHSGRLSLGAKAGTNHESHNHNDVGQFILAADGVPFVIDPGNSEYTRDTFGPKRYENPIMNSLYHNVPVFNGIGQEASDKAEARDVVCEQKDSIVRFSMELAGTYQDTLGLISCKRTLLLNLREKQLTVTDEWQSEQALAYSLSLMTTTEMANGVYSFQCSNAFETAPFEITDVSMKNNWKALWKTSILLPAATFGKNEITFRLK